MTDDVSPDVAEAASRLRGCLPGALAGVAVLIAIVALAFFGPGLLDDDDEASDPAASSSTTPSLTTGESPTPTSTPTETATSDPTADGVDLTGRFEKVAGQKLKVTHTNSIGLAMKPSGMTGSMSLVVDGQHNFDEPEPVCYSFAVDLIDKPVPVTTTDSGGLSADGPVTVVVGFSDGECTGGLPDNTGSRKGQVSLVYDPAVGTHQGVLTMEGTPLTFSVTQ